MISMVYDWYKAHERGLTPAEKLSSGIIRAVGSIESLVFHTILFLGAFAIVAIGLLDMSDMLLWLTTIVSLEAIYLCILTQIGLNMSASRDAAFASHDREVNQQAEEDIEALQELIEEIDSKKFDKILANQLLIMRALKIKLPK